MKQKFILLKKELENAQISCYRCHGATSVSEFKFLTSSSPELRHKKLEDQLQQLSFELKNRTKAEQEKTIQLNCNL